MWANTVSRTKEVAKFLLPARAAWGSFAMMKMCTQRQISGMQRQSGGGSSNLSPSATPQTWGGRAEDRQHGTAVQPSSPVALQHHDLASCQAIFRTGWKKKQLRIQWVQRRRYLLPLGLCVVGVHPAVGGAAFSGATTSQDHQYINWCEISEGYEGVGRFATEMKKWISLIYKFYLYNFHVHIRSASNFH